MQERITTAGVLEREGTYLVGRRIKGGSIGRLWEFPGGKNRWGETEADTLMREWDEELNLHIAVGSFLMSYDFTNKETRYHLKAYRVFCTDLSKMELRVHTEVHFFDVKLLRTLPFAPSDQKILEILP
ncbi:MAG: NUDIX domain-containing protein [Sphaerochaetaceae bacterium]|jgi:mutator protein MutT